MCQAILAADVNRVSVAHENESESLREAISADDVERLIFAHSKLSIRFKLSIIFKLSSCNLFKITSYRGLFSSTYNVGRRHKAARLIYTLLFLLNSLKGGIPTHWEGVTLLLVTRQVLFTLLRVQISIWPLSQISPEPLDCIVRIIFVRRTFTKAIDVESSELTSIPGIYAIKTIIDLIFLK